MKKSILFASLFFAINGIAQDITINQINTGYSYNASTGVISGIYFDVMNTSDSDDAGEFKISIVLSDPSNPQTIYEAANLTIDNLSASSSREITDWDVDLNNALETIPSGQYRIGVYVDSHDNISESDEDNNYYYISSQGNNITFSQGNSASIFENAASSFSMYPNPTNENTTISFSSLEERTIQIYDMAGKIVSNTNSNQQVVKINLEELVPNIYNVVITSQNGVKTHERLVISK